MPASICVAIPVRNGAAHLALAVESALAQEGVDVEVRIVDNGSSDGSLELGRGLAAADPRVSHAVNDENVGYYGSLNRILSETAAELFVPFACDDLMLPGNLARKAAALAETGAGFAHSSTYIIDGQGTVLRLQPDHREVAPVLEAPSFFSVIGARNAVIPSSVLARTDALRAIGGFDARPLYCSDWLTWLRLSLRHRVVTLRDPLVAYRVHENTGTVTCHREGLNGRDVPAVLDRVFLDDAMPAGWADWRDPLVAVTLSDNAQAVHRNGLERAQQGWAGYMLMGRALARLPHDAQLPGRYHHLVQAAGLTAPTLPFEAILPGGVPDGEADAVKRTIAEIGPLLGRLLVAVDPEAVDAELAKLEPVFGDTELDVVLVPTADATEMLLPGRVTIAAWGSALIAASEAAGVPVYPYAIPDPFGRAPDASRWETVDPAGCLP